MSARSWRTIPAWVIVIMAVAQQTMAAI